MAGTDRARRPTGRANAMLTSLPNLLTLSRIGSDRAAWSVCSTWTTPSATGRRSASTFRLHHRLLRRLRGPHLNQLSKLGRFLDPIADKLLVACIILMLVANGIIDGVHVLPGVVILVREIVVSGLREFLAELKVGVPVSRLAKWKTTAQMLALGFLIVGPAGPAVFQTILIGQVLLWIAAVLTIDHRLRLPDHRPASHDGAGAATPQAKGEDRRRSAGRRLTARRASGTAAGTA